MSKLIPKEEFLKSEHCLRCGIIGETRMCDTCKDLKKCKVCSIILRESFRFYRYDPNKKGTFYRESSYIIKSPYPEDKDGKCIGCYDWEMRMKFICFLCGEWFSNTLSNYKINGNCCQKH